MTVYLNNKPLEVETNSYVTTVLNMQGLVDGGGIAVAINNSVIPKRDWENTLLKENDKLMIITATAGG